MVHQPPIGARDLLPVEVAQKHWIEDRLQHVFHRWGYHRIITSTLERMDTLMAGGAIQQSAVIQLQNMEDEALGLRPELTASVARAAVTRMAGDRHPQRLYYVANVFRRPDRSNHNRQLEFYQTGVELLNTGGIAADAEILLLLSDCLNNLNLNQWYLILGEAGLTQSLLAVFPNGIREHVRRAIAHLDRITLENLCLPKDLQDWALFLLDLRGRPTDVIQRLTNLDLNPVQRTAVNNLKSLLELLQNSFTKQGERHGNPPAIVLDLSLLRTFDYYTGIIFEAVSGSSFGQRVLGQGGRYDQLLGLYNPIGETYPGIGFSLNTEEIHQVLLSIGQLPMQTPASNWLVVPTTPEAYVAAFAYAQKIRESTNLVRVEVDLGGQNTQAAIRDYARDRRISQIAWVDTEGLPKIEAL